MPTDIQQCLQLPSQVPAKYSPAHSSLHGSINKQNAERLTSHQKLSKWSSLLSLNLFPRPLLCFLTGTQSATNLGHYLNHPCYSRRQSQLGTYGTWLAAWSGVFADCDDISSAYSSTSTPTTSASSTHARTVVLNHIIKAGCNFSRHPISASRTVVAIVTQTSTPFPNSPPAPNRERHQQRFSTHKPRRPGVYQTCSCGDTTPFC